ncbi:MAG TPA: S46 family peptidase, partial [Thermoanaerobaculia bacterium]|nr:S46 family peptidase [Thermoanaerobaculia bacterium]
MKIARRIPFVLTCLLAVFAGREGSAVEGKWTPQQLRELDPKWLRELGLTLPVEKLWGPDGGGLLASVPSLDGCSSGFVSAEGLVITNHHCAYGILQLHSTPEKDLIKNGFLARTRAEELSGRGERATLPVRITDVTAEIQAAVPAGADDLARFQAIERKT